jgi:hypothetical protein
MKIAGYHHCGPKEMKRQRKIPRHHPTSYMLGPSSTLNPPPVLADGTREAKIIRGTCPSSSSCPRIRLVSIYHWKISTKIWINCSCHLPSSCKIWDAMRFFLQDAIKKWNLQSTFREGVAARAVLSFSFFLNFFSWKNLTFGPLCFSLPWEPRPS